MSSGIEQNSDMVYSAKGGTPWHGMGEAFDRDIEISDLLENPNLNFKVEKRQLFDATGAVWENKHVLTRADNGRHLSDTPVTEDYQIFQNEDAFKFFDPICSAGFAKIVTAGVIRGGEKGWALAKLENESYEPIPGAEHKTYLLLLTGHDHKTSLSILDTMIRVVCQNTVYAAMAEGAGRAVKIHHKKGIHEAAEAIGELTMQSRKKFANLEQIFKRMASLPIDQESLERYIRISLELPYRNPKEIIEDEEKLAALEERIRQTSRTVNRVLADYETERETLPFFAQDTHLHAFEGLTRFLSHTRFATKPERRFENNLLGEAQSYRSRAMWQSQQALTEATA